MTGNNTYAHMCRDDHVQIGHNDSEHELCPLCRANGEIAYLRDEIAGLREEIEMWKDRLAAEQQAHEATIKEAEAMFNSV